MRVTAWTLDEKLRDGDQREVADRRLPRRARAGTAAAGCVVTSDGSLLVGTGDAAQGTNPQDLDSLGGKTLRLDRFTGAPWPANPSSPPRAARAATCTRSATATSRA